MKIGIAGTGRMGSAIAGRLLALGYDVTVWNRTPARALALATAGATVAASPRDLASRSDIVMTLLTDAAAIENVYLGNSGLLSASITGRLFMEMSTVAPASAQALAPKTRALGGGLIDCPVGGTVGPASSGQLFAFVGGETADFERARPVLTQLCRRIEHVGPVGSGATLKLAANMAVQVYWQSFGEALALCAPLGLDPERLLDIFTDTSGAPRVLHHRAPDIAATLRGAAIAPINFDVDSVRKDLRAMLEQAKATDKQLPVVERVLQCFDRASRQGHGAADCATLPALWARGVRT
jgi:3-hydroxyisobutyrate dehydrogenase